MNRRAFFLGSTAALAASCAQAQVSVIDGQGRRLTPPQPTRQIINHSELRRLWDDIRQSSSVADARERVAGRFGPFPWVFRGSVELGRDGYETVEVVLYRLYEDPEAKALGIQIVLAEYEFVQPASMNRGLQHISLRVRGG